MHAILKFISSLMVFLFVMPGLVIAQEYVFEQGGNNNFSDAQIIDEPQNQKYIYGSLGVGQDKVDYYSFEFSSVTPQFQLELLLSNKEAKKNFKPSLILTEPQQKTMIGSVPFGFPNNVGGRLYTWDKMPAKKFDDVVLENFHQGIALIKDFSKNRYFVGVFDPEGKGGKYVLFVGSKKPDESLVGKFQSFLALLRIKLSLY